MNKITFKSDRILKKCSVPDCDRPRKHHKYCERHYLQIRRHGKIISNQRSVRDPNEIIIDENIARILLYDRLGNLLAETIIDAEFVDLVSQYKWYLSNYHYVVTNYKNKNGKYEKVSLHRLIMSISNNYRLDGKYTIEHIDENRLNNLKINLRICLNSQKIGTLTVREMLNKICEMQDLLNIHTNGINWKSANIPWYRAIFIEYSEMMNYLPWKWWKGGCEDLEQLKLELIDILHFGISDILTTEKYVLSKINFMMNVFEFYKPNNEASLEELIETTVKSTLQTKHFDIVGFVNIAKRINLDIPEIYKLYMGKNVLNKFRQDHGYKQKTYIKTWNGKEDNFYLMQILNEITEIEEDFEQKIYKALEELYKNSQPPTSTTTR